jgi:hypothetical protein
MAKELLLVVNTRAREVALPQLMVVLGAAQGLSVLSVPWLLSTRTRLAALLLLLLLHPQVRVRCYNGPAVLQYHHPHHQQQFQQKLAAEVAGLAEIHHTVVAVRFPRKRW